MCKRIVIPLLVGAVLLVGALYAIAHTWIAPMTEEISGTVASLSAAEAGGTVIPADSYVLVLEGSSTAYTLPPDAGAALAETVRTGDAVSLRYESSTFHPVREVTADTGEQLYQSENPFAARQRTANIIAVVVYIIFAAVIIAAGRKRARKQN